MKAKNNIDALQDAIHNARHAARNIIATRDALVDVIDSPPYRYMRATQLVLLNGYIDKLVSALDDAARLADPKLHTDD